MLQSQIKVGETYMAKVSGKLTVVELYGHKYTVDHTGTKIHTVACDGRYPASPPKFVGDPWIITELERYLAAPANFVPAQ